MAHLSHREFPQRKAVMTERRPYTVRFRTPDNTTIENCFYATDAFQARLLAMEFNRYINDHPNRIDKIFSETQR